MTAAVATPCVDAAATDAQPAHAAWRSTGELFAQLPVDGISAHHWQLFQALQDERPFGLAYAKAARTQRLRQVFGGRVDPVHILLADPRLEYIEWPVKRTPQRHVALTDLAAAATNDPAALKDAMVLLTNGAVQTDAERAALQQLAHQCQQTILVGWDTDNHHGLQHSLFMAAHVDIYAPSHLDNLYPLAMVNPALCPVTSGCIVWSRQFLLAHAPLILRTERSDSPLGIHKWYGCFGLRNRIVSTLAQHFPDVTLSADPLHRQDPLRNLERMCAHAVHWVVPTLNDLSTRVFDVFATGGIPLLPAALRHHPGLAEVRERDVVFYDAADIVAPQAVVRRANERFRAQGLQGVARRFAFGLRSHGDHRLLQAAQAAAEAFDFVLSPASP